MRNWIGIDAHNDFCEMAALNDKGNLICRVNIITKAEALVEAILKVKGERYIVVEESSIAQWLYLTLKPYANKIVVSDPKRNKLIHGDEDKDDKIDCLKLADLYRMGYVSEVYHTDVDELNLLRRVVLHYDRVAQNSIRAMNRIKAQYQYYGIFIKGKSVYNPKKRNEYLNAIESEIVREIISNYYKQLDLYSEQRKELKEKLQRMAKKYEAVKKIKTVPGIGPIRAIMIFAILLTPDRFSNRSKLNKYCGLAVAEKKSAGKVYCSYASRSGNRLLKSVFIDAATTCISICNSNYFSNHYQELRLRGLSEKAAKRTIAREILHVVIGVWKNNKSYSSQIHINNRRRDDNKLKQPKVKRYRLVRRKPEGKLESREEVLAKLDY